MVTGDRNNSPQRRFLRHTLNCVIIRQQFKDYAMKERLQKLMAQAGIGSRRACEEIIRQGRVEVDGKIASLGLKADPAHQHITVDGQPLAKREALVYLALHKPKGILAVSQDDRGRRTIRDLIPLPGHLFPVGRLDAMSEGLVLLTNDGALTNRLTHPRYRHTKEYRVYVAGHPDKKILDRWQRGIILDGKKTAPATVAVLQTERDHTLLRVVLQEGRKRQIRKVAAMLGHPVRRLIRVRIGPVLLGDLKPSQWRHLTRKEIKNLRSQTS